MSALFTTHGCLQVYHLYVVRARSRDARDSLIRHLSAAGIGCAVHYPVPPHRQPVYGSELGAPGDFPIAEALADTSLSLPLYPGMTHMYSCTCCKWPLTSSLPAHLLGILPSFHTRPFSPCSSLLPTPHHPLRTPNLHPQPAPQTSSSHLIPPLLLSPPNRTAPLRLKNATWHHKFASLA